MCRRCDNNARFLQYTRRTHLPSQNIIGLLLYTNVNIEFITLINFSSNLLVKCLYRQYELVENNTIFITFLRLHFIIQSLNSVIVYLHYR